MASRPAQPWLRIGPAEDVAGQVKPLPHLAEPAQRKVTAWRAVEGKPARGSSGSTAVITSSITVATDPIAHQVNSGGGQDGASARRAASRSPGENRVEVALGEFSGRSQRPASQAAGRS